MKINSLLKKAILTMSCLYCLHVTTTFAFFETPTSTRTDIPVKVTNIGYIGEVLSGIYNKSLHIIADLIYEFDAAIPKIIAQNAQVDNAQQAVDKNVKTDLDNAISFDFNTDQAKKAYVGTLLDSTKAEDDIPLQVDLPSNSIFGPPVNTNKNKDDALIKQLKAGNAVFNVDTLLMPYQYKKTAEKDEEADALKYLSYLASSAPTPTVIRISNKFNIPSIDPGKSMDPKALDTIELDGSAAIDKEGKIKNTPENLISYLNQDSEYQNYKAAYRAMTSGKTLYLRNLLRSYRARIALDGNNTSMAQLNHDEAYRRLNQEYYKAMSEASPAVVEREILFLLAQIHRDFYEMSRDNERRMVMDSISGLQASSISNVMLSQTIKSLNKKMYCWNTPWGKPKDPSCGDSTGGQPGAPSIPASVTADIPGMKQ